MQGDATVSGSSRDVLIGATADGGSDAFANTIGGGLSLTGNSANLRVANTTVYGALALDANTPGAIFGAGVRAGSTTGDYTGEAPTAPPTGDQSIAVTVPDQGSGELTWSIEGTSRLVDLGVAEQELDHFHAEGEIIPIRIQDTRAGNPGWSLTAQVSDFTAGGEQVSSKYLGWTPEVLENAGDAVAVLPSRRASTRARACRSLARSRRRRRATPAAAPSWAPIWTSSSRSRPPAAPTPRP